VSERGFRDTQGSMTLGVCHLPCEAVNIFQVLCITPNTTLYSYYNLQRLTALNLIYGSYTDRKIHRAVKAYCSQGVTWQSVSGLFFSRNKESTILGKAHFLSMYDKVSEQRELFLLVTQVGYIVKKTEKCYLIYKTSLSLGKPSLSAFCLRYGQDVNGHRFLR